MTIPEQDDKRGSAPPASEVMRVARKISGTLEIDARAGFEHVVRECTENALTCYRAAHDARDVGDEAEALRLCEVAEQSLDLARESLCRIEGL